MTDTSLIHTPDGAMRVHVARPATPPLGAVVVLQEIFGVNGDIRDTCEWLADDGYVAVAPDLFWRQEAGVDMTDRHWELIRWLREDFKEKGETALF